VVGACGGARSYMPALLSSLPDNIPCVYVWPTFIQI
jgi:hypothetical protein